MRIQRLFLLATLALLLFACRKDEQFTSDSGARLTLTEDTVLFDTIFTTVGSVTKRFVVRNDNDQAVRVSISLAGGLPSPFRINVDGASGISFTDVEILGHDSIYIFVEATLDASNVNNPLIIEDHILLNTNGNEQKVLLLAWGQDAYFYPPHHDSLQYIPGLPVFSYIARENQNVVWTNDKPHVISYYGVIDENATLTIEPGTRVYFHGPASGMWVYVGGKISANGTVEERITFQGDRLEPQYADLPGQWDRIWINEGASGNDNIFTNVVIKNAFIGLQCQTFPLTAGQPTSSNRLMLNNVRIQNCATAGLYAENYRVDARNLLVANAGQYCAVLTGGGQYAFDHATLANYWSFGVRQDPAFFLSNSFVDAFGATQVREIEPSTFVNGIVHGTNTNELKMEIDGAQPAAFTFSNYLFHTDQPTNDTGHFPDQGSIYRNQEPGFADPATLNFHLLEGAFARNKGVSTPNTTDLDGRTYGELDGLIDLGCFEYVP